MKDFKPCLFSLLRSVRNYRGKLSLTCFVGIVSVAASLVFVWMSEKVVNIAGGVEEGSLVAGAAALLAILLLQLGCRIFAKYWIGLVMVDTQIERRREIFAKALLSGWNGKEKYHSADTVNRLEEDVRVTTEFICEYVPEIVVTLVQLIAASIYLFVKQPKLAWILILIMPVAMLASKLYFRTIRKLTGEIRAGDSRVQGHVQENLQHRLLIKTFNAEEKVLLSLDSLQGEVRSKTMERLKYLIFSMVFMNFGFTSGYGLVFLWGLFGLKNGTVSYGMIVALLQLVGQVQRPVASMAQQLSLFIKALSSQERIMDLQELKEEDLSESVMFKEDCGVRVSGLSFRYDDTEKNVLDDLDYDFRPGSVTLVLGPTGSGKSTLARLMLSLLRPSSGSVEIYAGDTAVQCSPRTRCNFMYVPQGNTLMSGTIRDNLLLADRDADDETLRRVLHIAVADFVYDLEQGLDTFCSEVGGGLSEGQAQRISIARALLRKGGILILDEASSALDNYTEELLLKRIAGEYRGKKTIICITHRTAASSYADSVLNLGPTSPSRPS